MTHIKKFQKKNNLQVDGIIGNETLNCMMNLWALSSEEIAHFIGQLSHETMGFVYDEENLDYSAQALLNVFGKYFKTSWQAELYEYKPIEIANYVYANRMGNGDEESGDGWRYRGRGAIMLTGRYNYESFANKVRDLSIMESPGLVNEKYYFEVALHYFKKNDLWQYCCNVDVESIKKVTKKINGGYNGLPDRIKQVKYFYSLV